MDARPPQSPSPPPPPPGSPPPVDADTTTTTIGKYIARFRQESPRPRDARATTQRADFWWLEKSNERARATDTASGSSHTEHKRESKASPSGDHSVTKGSMEWELELLSGASELSEDASVLSEQAAATTTRSRGGGDSMASSSSAGGASPWRRQQRTDAHSVAVRARSGGWRGEDDDDAVIVDDGFVVLGQPVDDDVRLDETEMLAASLEDPEMVIQRIRRRLGFQPPALTGGASRGPFEPPSYSLSPLRDGEDQDGYLHHSFDLSEQLASVGRSSLQLDLSMSLEDMHLSDGGGGGDTPTSLAAMAPDSLAPREVEDTNAETEEMIHQKRVVDAIQESKDSQEESSTNDVVGEGQRTPAEALATSGADAEQGTTLETDEAEAMRTEELKEKSSTPCDDPPPPREAEGAPAYPEAPAHDSRAKQLPAVEEKRSPRLPPLSPARGPVFRAAPVTPRALDPIDPPEITAETSKTLDSLLSFVVHSWGENSFFGSDDGGDQASVDGGGSGNNSVQHDEEVDEGTPGKGILRASPMPTPSHYEEEEEREEDEPATHRQAQEAQETEEQEQDVHEEDDDPAAFAADPVVAMLRERIDLFEEALHRLDSM